MVLTQATNFGPEYHYCRTCKKELSELQPAMTATALRILEEPPTYGTFLVMNGGTAGVGTKVVSDHYGYFTPVEILDIDLARRVVKLPVQAGFTRTWEIPTKDFAQYFTIYHPVQTP
jgi:hypothetical protein